MTVLVSTGKRECVGLLIGGVDVLDIRKNKSKSVWFRCRERSCGFLSEPEWNYLGLSRRRVGRNEMMSDGIDEVVGWMGHCGI